MSGEPVAALAVSGIAKSYGGPLVLSDVNLSVCPDELLGVIGPNGSGKTTLFGIIAGQLKPNAGTVRLAGEDVTRLSAAQRARKGVGRTFQVPQSFGDMTVFENVLVGASFAGGLAGADADDFAMDIVERMGFRGRDQILAGTLPLLDRKRLEVARALATRPELLLLDEIAGGLTDDEAHEIAGAVSNLRGTGMAVIWIEHLVHILTGAVDRIVVLGEGRIIADGEPHATMAVPAVRQLYLGLEPDENAVGS